MSTTTQTVPERAGWTIAAWCAATSISRATLYDMPPEIAPQSVTLGRRRIIIEQPTDWLRRIAERDARAVA